MGRLQGKIALVTGAASIPGIGSATARRFAEEGAHVWMTDVDGPGVESLAKVLRGEGLAAFGMAHDVTKEADWDRVIAAIMDQHGRLDALVNNAGIFAIRAVADMDLALWNRINEINLASVFHGTKRAVQVMRGAGNGGSIINISSTAGLVGHGFVSAYAATKGGVRLFSKSVAMEVAPESIRVNTIHPGPIKTNLTVGTGRLNDDDSGTIATIPLRRMGQPIDVAHMALFLASDESSFITGAEMVVDGGVTAQ